MGWNDTLLLPKTLKINTESFGSQHQKKIKMVKNRSAISLQEAIDFCLDSDYSGLDSTIEKISSGED